MGQTARYNVSDKPTSIAVRDVLLKAEEIRLLSVQKDTSPCKKAVSHVGEWYNFSGKTASVRSRKRTVGKVENANTRAV